jgi:hypothetical protein
MAITVLTVRVRSDASFHWHTPYCIWVVIRFAERRLGAGFSFHVTVICQRLDPDNCLIPFHSYLPTHSFNKGAHFFPDSQILFILCIGFRG